jgi:hypothetical protein
LGIGLLRVSAILLTVVRKSGDAVGGEAADGCEADHVDEIDALDRNSFGDAAGGETAEDSEATNTVAQSDHVDKIDALDRKSFGIAADGEAAEDSEAMSTVEEEAFW